MPRPRERGPWFWRGAIGVMLFSVIGIFSVAAFHSAPALDPETACRMDRQDPAHTILLIDQSGGCGVDMVFQPTIWGQLFKDRLAEPW